MTAVEGSEWAAAVERLLAAAGRPGPGPELARRGPAAYQAQTPPAEAVLDLAYLDRLGHDGAGRLLAVRPTQEKGVLRIRRYGVEGVELSAFLPILESFALVVLEAVPYRINPGKSTPGAHLDDFGVRLADADGERLEFDIDRDGPRLVDALQVAIAGGADVDSLNRLVTLAGLDWQQVRVLRAYRRYRHQSGAQWTDAQLDDALARQPALARGLIGYFEACFDPDVKDRAAMMTSRRAAVNDALTEVASLIDDQVVRGYLALLDATWRTNYFQGGTDTHPVNLAFKLDSAAVPDLAPPRPERETFVHGPSVEGIHLRAGRIARGGIRWSDRPDDFRTEVLGLAEAQVKKNAIIVPTGAKGGFVCRRPPRGRGPTAESVASPSEVASSYDGFIRALLDVTDNIVAGQVRGPARVVRRDGDDPYLVVAADRGTATFSDRANQISREYGFWLDDAFASGGTRGYDHKAMGITARGAWVAVRRHFHQLGIDVQREPIRVVGVGDMSGDVFGNGMLQSQTIELVAAFDHRHIFLDPRPEPAAGFAERRRLAALPRSSWADYDRARLSPDGGVWDRQVKSVPLGPGARSALGIGPETDALSPPALISAILAAPVDLLFFGGIGTFVKAPAELDVEVGDHANDRLRITSDRLRARVVAEGGNLAITQAARIGYSRRGGRINTDFIDNAAGVATSDREVNLKILLALAIERGRLVADERDEVLAAVGDDVAGEVLRQVDHSVAALNRAVAASAPDLEAYEALIERLVQGGRLDRQVEVLPGADEMQARRQAGAGLIRPELAVLLAYAKSDLVEALEESALLADPALEPVVAAYFPAAIRDRFGDLLVEHRLYGQLLATDLAGELVDQMGIVWAHETASEVGRNLGDVGGAFWAARTVLAAGDAWQAIEALGGSVDADAEAELHRTVVEAVGYLARGYLTRPGALDVAGTVAADRPVADAITTSPHLLAGRQEIEASLSSAGVPPTVARRFATTAALARIADVGRLSQMSGWAPQDVLAAAAVWDRAAGLDRLADALSDLDVGGRWATWQVRALKDDMTALRRQAVTAIVTRKGSADVEAAVATWVAPRSAHLASVAKLIDACEHAGPDGVLVAGLALRALTRLL